MTVRSLGRPSRRPVDRPAAQRRPTPTGPSRRPARRHRSRRDHRRRRSRSRRSTTRSGRNASRSPGHRGRVGQPSAATTTICCRTSTVRCRRRRLPAGRRVPLRVHRAGGVPVLLHDPRHSRDRNDRHRRRHGHGLTTVRLESRRVSSRTRTIVAVVGILAALGTSCRPRRPARSATTPAPGRRDDDRGARPITRRSRTPSTPPPPATSSSSRPACTTRPST